MERSIDIEKVIKRLENTAGYFWHLQSVGFFGDQPVYREHEENCNNAIALLKEQDAETELCDRCGRVRLKSKWEVG